jgi:hypothetical protein
MVIPLRNHDSDLMCSLEKIPYEQINMVFGGALGLVLLGFALVFCIRWFIIRYEYK